MLEKNKGRCSFYWKNLNLYSEKYFILGFCKFHKFQLNKTTSFLFENHRKVQQDNFFALPNPNKLSTKEVL